MKTKLIEKLQHDAASLIKETAEEAEEAALKTLESQDTEGDKEPVAKLSISLQWIVRPGGPTKIKAVASFTAKTTREIEESFDPDQATMEL